MEVFKYSLVFVVKAKPDHIRGETWISERIFQKQAILSPF
jgi:hypothetical protein